MRKRKQSQTRLERSFLDINAPCASRALKRFSIKERGLVAMAENSIYYGIKDGDNDLDEKIDDYFDKMKMAFCSRLNFYLNSDFVFCFDGDILVEIFPVHKCVRRLVVEKFTANKRGFEELSYNEKSEYKSHCQREFLIEAGIIKPQYYEDMMDEHFGVRGFQDV